MKCVLFVLVLITQSFCLNLKELEDLFGDVECIEGELTFTNSPITPDSDGISLIKNKEIQLGNKAAPQEVEYLVQVKQELQDKNVLSLIHELCQHNDISSEYVLLAELGQPHERTFQVQLELGTEVYKGHGRTIKDAKRNAAAKALEFTNYVKPQLKSKEEHLHEIEKLTPTVHLNNIAAKLGIKVEYFTETANQILVNKADKYMYYSLDSTSTKYSKKLNNSMSWNLNPPDVENQSSHGPYHVRVDVGDESFVGRGWTIKAARHNAAEEALEKFRKMSVKDADECLKHGVLCNKLNVKQPVSLVYELAQKNKWSVSFEVVGESGPDHKKIFTVHCKVSDLVTKAEGNSKKQAKKLAAEEMLKLLKTSDPWDLISVKSASPSKKSKKKKRQKITRPGILDQAKMSILDAFSLETSEKEHTSNMHKVEKSPKDELLNLGNEIGINIKFSSYHDSDTDMSASLVSIETDPMYYCFAKDLSQYDAEDKASSHALKFLKHVGLNLVNVPLGKENDEKIVFISLDKTSASETKIEKQ